MVTFLLKHPVGVIMVFIAITILGAISTFRIPITLLPDPEVPVIEVVTRAPGYSPLEVEQKITEPLRRSLKFASGLDDLKGKSLPGQSRISLRFSHDTDLDLAYFEIGELIDRNAGFLPFRPEVIRSNLLDLPVLTICLFLQDTSFNQSQFEQLSSYAIRMLKPRLEQMEEIAMVDMSGIYRSRLIMEMDLSELNLDMVQVKSIKEQIKYQFGLSVQLNLQEKGERITLSIERQNVHVNSLKEFMVNLSDSVSFPLHQLASIKEVASKDGSVLFNGRRAVSMLIYQQPGVRLSRLKESVDDTLLEMSRNNAGVGARILFDQSKLVGDAVKGLINALIIGSILAAMLLLIVSGSARYALIMLICMSLSLIIAMLAIFLMGLTINIISLSGLILGIGLMTDSFLIVLENIKDHVNSSGKSSLSIRSGTNEIIRPMITSLLTTAVVFIPLVFLSDLAGALFFDQAVTIVIALSISFIVSITLLPLLFDLIMLNVIVSESRLESTLHRINNGLHHLSFSFGWKSILVFFLFIPAIYPLYNLVSKSVYPDLPDKDLILVVKGGLNASRHNVELQSNLLAVALKEKGINSVCYSGPQQFLTQFSRQGSYNELMFYLEREENTNTAGLNMIKPIAAYFFPGSVIKMERADNPFSLVFSDERNLIQVRLEGTNMDKTRSGFIHQLQMEGLLQDTTHLFMHEVLKLKVKREQLKTYGIDESVLIEHVKFELEGFEVPLYANQSSVNLIISGIPGDLYSKLVTSFVLNTDGNRVPLSKFIDIEKDTEPAVISSDREGAFLQFPVNAEYEDTEKIKARITQIASRKGIETTFSGGFLQIRQWGSELFLIFFISIALLYFLLAAQFESLFLPLIILIELCIDLAGVFIALYLFDSSLNVMSGIGIIVMSGIIINDSILKLDVMNRLHRTGTPLQKAVSTASRRRFIPILLTSLTTIFALVPAIFTGGMGAALQRPMAIAVIGGLSLGTMVSLYLLPLLYSGYFWLYSFIKDNMKRIVRLNKR
jgi:multidrug efflux pump subunit AcrB